MRLFLSFIIGSLWLLFSNLITFCQKQIHRYKDYGVRYFLYQCVHKLSNLLILRKLWCFLCNERINNTLYSLVAFFMVQKVVSIISRSLNPTKNPMFERLKYVFLWSLHENLLLKVYPRKNSFFAKRLKKNSLTGPDVLLN